MNDEIRRLVQLIKEKAPEHCSEVNIFISNEEFRVDYSVRDPESLKRSGISMKNINGEWIEE